MKKASLRKGCKQPHHLHSKISVLKASLITPIRKSKLWVDNTRTPMKIVTAAAFVQGNQGLYKQGGRTLT